MAQQSNPSILTPCSAGFRASAQRLRLSDLPAVPRPLGEVATFGDGPTPVRSTVHREDGQERAQASLYHVEHVIPLGDLAANATVTMKFQVQWADAGMAAAANDAISVKGGQFAHLYGGLLELGRDGKLVESSCSYRQGNAVRLLRVDDEPVVFEGAPRTRLLVKPVPIGWRTPLLAKPSPTTENAWYMRNGVGFHMDGDNSTPITMADVHLYSKTSAAAGSTSNFVPGYVAIIPEPEDDTAYILLGSVLRGDLKSRLQSALTTSTSPVPRKVLLHNYGVADSLANNAAASFIRIPREVHGAVWMDLGCTVSGVAFKNLENVKDTDNFASFRPGTAFVVPTLHLYTTLNMRLQLNVRLVALSVSVAMAAGHVVTVPSAPPASGAGDSPCTSPSNDSEDPTVAGEANSHPEDVADDVEALKQ